MRRTPKGLVLRVSIPGPHSSPPPEAGEGLIEGAQDPSPERSQKRSNHQGQGRDQDTQTPGARSASLRSWASPLGLQAPQEGHFPSRPCPAPTETLPRHTAAAQPSSQILCRTPSNSTPLRSRGTTHKEKGSGLGTGTAPEMCAGSASPSEPPETPKFLLRPQKTASAPSLRGAPGAGRARLERAILGRAAVTQQDPKNLGVRGASWGPPENKAGPGGVRSPPAVGLGAMGSGDVPSVGTHRGISSQVARPGWGSSVPQREDIKK